MTTFGKIVVCLAGGLALCAGLRAADVASNNAPLPDNPYATIVTRNVFGLNPPPPPDTNSVVASLPKITPGGIMSVYGKLQVLIKVTPTGKASKSTKDQYYTLSEGERQDEIEVMRIDDQNGIITFKNHGTVQEIPLAEVASSSGGAPSPSAPFQRNQGGLNLPGRNGDNQGGGRITRFGNRGGGGPGGFNRRGNNNQDSNGDATGNGDDSLNLRSIPTRTYQPPVSNLTPEESTIAIEAQRAEALDKGDPKAALFPPTPLTGKY